MSFSFEFAFMQTEMGFAIVGRSRAAREKLLGLGVPTMKGR
jgi:hypothetical protein